MQKIIRLAVISLFIVLSGLSFAAGGKYGPTTSADNIWKIADSMKPSEEVTTQQVALGIFYRNRDAFYSDNINALKAGKILEIPDARIVSSISKEAAAKELNEHSRRWAERNKSSKKVEQKNEANSQDSLLNSSNGEKVASEGDASDVESQPEEVLVEEQQDTAVQKKPEDDVSDSLVEDSISPQEQSDSVIIDDSSFNDSLMTEDSNVKQQMEAFNERLDGIEVQLNELTQFNEKMKNSFLGGFFLLMEGYSEGVLGALGPVLFMIIVGLIVLLLLVLLIYLVMPKNKEKNIDYLHDEEIEEGDFNYTDHEDNTAKLNLARAYIDMGELDKAKSELQEVLLHGTDEEQQEAKEILDEMKGSE